jgi:hypothetical protein
VGWSYAVTRQERGDLIAVLRMLSLVNPKKWSILGAAANELKRLELELDKLRNGK